MAIDFDGTTSGQYIDFGDGTGVKGLTSKTILFSFYQDTYKASRFISFLLNNSALTTSEREDLVINNTNGQLTYFRNYTTTNGLWSTSTSPFVTGEFHRAAVTFDGSTVVFYRNGSALTTTVNVAPVGSLRTGSSNVFALGGAGGSAFQIDGRFYSYLVYNRVFSQAEVADAHGSYKEIPTWRGLVYAPLLIGARGLQAFDGATLGSSNYIIDRASGSLGTPTGSPVGRADNYLYYG